uniref:Uncharacterized protein n=1 Tax=Glossina pallidipes TaxID=7398 RepID=A0A1A9Z941_GLOPL
MQLLAMNNNLKSKREDAAQNAHNWSTTKAIIMRIIEALIFRLNTKRNIETSSLKRYEIYGNKRSINEKKCLKRSTITLKKAVNGHLEAENHSHPLGRWSSQPESKKG